MTAQLAPTPVFKAFDNNGEPLANGQLQTLAAGTSTPQATYVDSTQSTPNTNPVILNARGEANVWLDPTLTYKLVLRDSFGNQIWSVDNINGSLNPNASIIPAIDNLYTLGNATFSWANVYIGINHAPVLDIVSGNIGYYAQTAAEITAVITPVNFSYPPLNILRYGADPQGNSASDTAMANAITVCGAFGGTIRCPAGTYLFNTGINLDSKVSIFIEGDGGANAAAATPTVFRFSSAGSGNFIFAGSSTGCSLRKLAIFPTQAGFTGTLVALGHGLAGGDANFFTMLDCTLGTDANISCTHLNLDKSIICTFERCQFNGGLQSVKGQAAAGGSYSNVMTFKLCEWALNAQTPIAFMGEAWTFDSCTFEGIPSGGNVIAGAMATNNSAPVKGLTITGCWLGDITAAGGTWLTLFGVGISITGNRFGGFATGTQAISLNNVQGISITGNSFDTFSACIDFTTAPIVGVSIKGNTILGGSPQLVSNAANIPINAELNPNSPITPLNGNTGLLSANGWEASPNGLIRQWGSSTVTTSTPLAISFPKTFPNNVWSINVSLASPTGGGNTVYSTSVSSSGFTANVAGTAGSNTVYWQAIGN